MDAPPDYASLTLLVSEHTEESTTLEFKRQLPESGKNDDLAKDISAMANTEGGVVIVGVVEEKGRAFSLEPIDLRQAVERVSHVARTLDEPLDVNAYTILDPSLVQGFLVVVVPLSHRAPHFMRGQAWGRADKNIYTLSRRRIGELFARQEGFAEEFGLRMARKAGRLKVSPLREVDRGHPKQYLVFENDGEADILDASWFAEGVQPIENPFPISRMHPGARTRVFVRLGDQARTNILVAATWTDEQGNENQAEWPVSWL